MIPSSKGNDGASQSFYDNFKANELREIDPKTNSGHALLRKLKNAGGKQQINRRPGSGEKKVFSYPEKQGPSQITGDRFLIKCLEFEPPDDGVGLGLEIKNAFYKTKVDGKEKYNVITAAQREANAKAGKPIDAMELKLNPTDATMRMSAGQRRLTKYMIELPIPQDLNDSNSVTWGEDRMNAIELAGLTIAQEAMATADPGRAAVEAARLAIEAFNTGISVPGLNSDTQSAVRAALSGAAIGALGSNVRPASVIARSTGQILNNNLELLFQGVNLRSFPYSITFSPRSPTEAETVKQIIKHLKMSMAPKAGEFSGTAEGIFIKSPDVFMLKYLKDGADHPFLNSFKLCALTGMTVSYTNAGTYTTYEDGTPVNIRVNLTFKELNPIYHEDYATEGAGPGVGY
tara:strand:- start:716 stop:1924 length:1209 start_codon:yes stop_codon:yes gene_type:complete